MKKTLSIILTAVMVLGMLAVIPMSGTAAPAGTAVKTEAEFLAMAADGTYYLDADITLTQTYVGPFTGTFDGNGKTVTITTGAMFQTVENAKISNFTVKGDITMADAGYAVGSEDFAAAVAIVATGTSSFSDITSNVNFTSTSANTRYGAIAATSTEGCDLSIVNCVNNGNITVVKYAGGIYGWMAKVGKGYFKRCINNGTIVADGYAGGIVNRLANKGTGITLIVENCINKGNITGSYGGGMVAYSNAFVQITGCVNFADITAVSGGSTGGIAGNLDQVGNEGNHVVKNNINYGNITNTAEKHTGGIVGYVYGSGNYAAFVENNINYGTVSSAKYCSQILGYTNSNMTQIINNIGAGKLVGSNDNTAVFVGLSSADITQYIVKGNYYVENDGTKMYSYADKEDHAANRLALEARPEGALTFVAADKFTNGEVATALNTAAGATIFEVRDGKTLLVCSHDYLIVDGKCSACGADASTIHIHSIVDVPAVAPTCTEKGNEAGKKCSTCDYVEGCKEIAATGHKFTDGKCSVCQADDPNYVPAVTTTEGTTAGDNPTVDNTTAAQVTEPEDKGCGGFSVFAALIAIVSAAGVVVFKKKA